MKSFKVLLTLLLLFLFPACGGGGGGGKSGSSITVSGQFISSYVEGLKVCSENGYCTYTDSNGRFFLKAENFPVHVTFFVGNLKLGDYTLEENNELVNPFKLAGNSQMGDVLAKFIHGMAGDTGGGFKTLNFSGLKVLNTNLSPEKSLLDAVKSGEDVNVELQNSSGETYSVKYLPEDNSVKLCKTDGNCWEVNYRQWLVLVYMAADNSLNDNALGDLGEMEAVKFNPQVKLVVLTDFISEPDQITESDDMTGNFVSENLGYEVDTGNYQTLESFVRTYYNRFPAKNVALILWDHGDGWRSRIAAFDDTNSSFLSMFQLRKALSELNSEGINFSLIGFDECLMGMEEVLYDIKDFTDYAVASENNEPGTGWDYSKVFSYLVSNPNATPQQFGRAIVDAYRDTYSSSNSGFTLTLTLFSRADVERIANDLNELYNDLNENTFSDFLSARNASQQVVCSENSLDCSYYYVDLYSFASQLSGKYTEAKNIVNTINSLYKTIIPGADGKDLHGISIYFPGDMNQAENSGYECYTAKTLITCSFGKQQVDGYYNPFAAETYWDDFLAKYLSLE